MRLEKIKTGRTLGWDKVHLSETPHLMPGQGYIRALKTSTAYKYIEF
jgi:hypothetical protein